MGYYRAGKGTSLSIEEVSATLIGLAQTPTITDREVAALYQLSLAGVLSNRRQNFLLMDALEEELKRREGIE